MRNWVLAARPKTLFAAVAPVIVGSAAAWRLGVFRPGPALAALIGAGLIQIGTNLANDLADFERGADAGERAGPVRVTQAGLLTANQVRGGMWLTFGLAALCGAYLTFIAGWPVIVIGLVSIAAGIAYTGGPFPFGYHGLGDLFVFLFFGMVAVNGTFFVQAGRLDALAVWSAVPVGFLSMAILVVNNYRDLKTDRLANKNTLAVIIGPRLTRVQFGVILALSYTTPLLMVLADLAGPAVLLSWLTLPAAAARIREMHTRDGPALNQTLAKTSLLELSYSLLFALGLLIP